jgi:hypothetical protein
MIEPVDMGSGCFNVPYGTFKMTPEQQRYFDLGEQWSRAKRGLWWRLVDWWKAS